MPRKELGIAWLVHPKEEAEKGDACPCSSKEPFVATAAATDPLPSLCPHLCKTPAWAGSLHLALHVPPAPAWLKPPCQKYMLGTSCFPQGPPHPAGSPCVGTGMGPCLSPCSVLQQQSVCGTLASKAFKFWIFK